jgi:hypothetical protein
MGFAGGTRGLLPLETRVEGGAGLRAVRDARADAESLSQRPPP